MQVFGTKKFVCLKYPNSFLGSVWQLSKFNTRRVKIFSKMSFLDQNFEKQAIPKSLPLKMLLKEFAYFAEILASLFLLGMHVYSWHLWVYLLFFTTLQIWHTYYTWTHICITHDILLYNYIRRH